MAAIVVDGRGFARNSWLTTVTSHERAGRCKTTTPPQPIGVCPPCARRTRTATHRLPSTAAVALRFAVPQSSLGTIVLLHGSHTRCPAAPSASAVRSRRSTLEYFVLQHNTHITIVQSVLTILLPRSPLSPPICRRRCFSDNFINRPTVLLLFSHWCDVRLTGYFLFALKDCIIAVVGRADTNSCTVFNPFGTNSQRVFYRCR